MNGWNVTGDTFVRDEDGYFYYQARTDNMIVSSGYNIGGPEVEAAIDEHPDGRGVGGRGQPGRGPRARSSARSSCSGTAWPATRPGQGDPGPRQGALAPYKYPRDVRFAAALPRNASGKLQHFALRGDPREGAAAAEAKESPS